MWVVPKEGGIGNQPPGRDKQRVHVGNHAPPCDQGCRRRRRVDKQAVLTQTAFIPPDENAHRRGAGRHWRVGGIPQQTHQFPLVPPHGGRHAQGAFEDGATRNGGITRGLAPVGITGRRLNNRQKIKKNKKRRK